MIRLAARRRGGRRLIIVLVACGVFVPLSTFAAKNPVAVFQEFCRFFDQRYAFFDLRGVDWPQQKAAYRPRVTAATTDDELFAIMCEMIDPLDDHHTSVTRGSSKCFADDFLPWHGRSGEIQRFIQLKYLRTPATVAGAITYGLIDEATGYIDIRHMGCKSGSEMDQALAVMTPVKKIVLDLRFNRGGYDTCALGLASRFADQKRLVVSRQVFNNGTFGRRHDMSFAPRGRVQATARLVVLTSRETISAGETFVMAMMMLPRAIIVGEPTGGFHSDIWERKLSNGWIVGLSAEKFILPDGEVYEKVGLPPHLLIPFAGDVIEKARDELLEAAVAL